jgi:hypothetical protein
MINGMAIMQKTPYGWKVKSFYATEFVKYRQRIEVIRGELILCGNFVKKPKCGYSKKPQVLLGVSK